MIVKLKQNFKRNGVRYKAGSNVELQDVLGVDEIPLKYRDVFQKVVVDDDLKISLQDPKEDVETKKETEKDKKEKSQRTKQDKKSGQKPTLNIDELDMNV